MSSALTMFSTIGAYAALFALLLLASVSDIRKRMVSNRIVAVIVLAWVIWRLVVIVDAFTALGALDIVGEGAGAISDMSSDMMPAAMLPLAYLRPVSAIGDTFASLFVAIAIAFILFAIVSLYERIRGKYAFGGADIKLIAAIALFVSVEIVCAIVFIACAISFIYALASLYSRNPRGIPFAPCLACALPLALLVV